MAVDGVREWTRGPAIGRGSSATVSLAIDRGTGAVFAVKSVEAARAQELRREQSILLGLSSSPHVVRCLGYSGASAAGREDLFLEYAPGGSLADEIRRCGGRCEERLIRWRARDILRGLAHAHAAGVAHCDVKARNVLIGADGRAMIADFGCARRVGAGVSGSIGGGRMMRGGTPMFMAPEAARGEEQATAADIWALGCTVIEMATGGAPWPMFADPIAALRHVALSGEVPELPQWLSEEGKDFLARCFRRDPRERWTAEQLLEHQFVATAASSSNSVTRITEKEPFVSPKSVLDQALWDDSTADTAAATATAPTDRVRALAAGAPAAPDWTWDANWITVHRGDGDDVLPAPPPELETDAGSDPVIRSSAAGSVVSGVQTAVGHGDSYGGPSDSFCGGNHVVSHCNLAITGNRFFRRCSVTFAPSFLSQLAAYVSHVLLFYDFFFFPSDFFPIDNEQCATGYGSAERLASLRA